MEHLIDQTVRNRLFRGHVEVAVSIPLDHIQGLTGDIGEELIELGFQPHDFPRHNLDIARLTFRTAKRLVEVDRRMRQGVTLTLGATGKQDGAEACCNADSNGADGILNHLHRIQNGKTRVN